MLKYCLDKYKNKGMCEKAVKDYPSTSRFVPDMFITPKMFKELSVMIALLKKQATQSTQKNAEKELSL